MAFIITHDRDITIDSEHIAHLVIKQQPASTSKYALSALMDNGKEIVIGFYNSRDDAYAVLNDISPKIGGATASLFEAADAKYRS